MTKNEYMKRTTLNKIAPNLLTHSIGSDQETIRFLDCLVHSLRFIPSSSLEGILESCVFLHVSAAKAGYSIRQRTVEAIREHLRGKSLVIIFTDSFNADPIDTVAYILHELAHDVLAREAPLRNWRAKTAQSKYEEKRADKLTVRWVRDFLKQEPSEILAKEVLDFYVAGRRSESALAKRIERHHSQIEQQMTQLRNRVDAYLKRDGVRNARAKDQ